jgi:phosphoribosylamine--glycine ligase
MRIVIFGSGGREHALAWRCVSEGHEVHVAPGSDGIAGDALCHPLALADHPACVALARHLGSDLAIVGPEQPLVDGLADKLRAAGIVVFGPSAAAAELEGSKALAKDFMVRHAIPTARHVRVDSLANGLAALRSFAEPPVVKASGLAAGKGVTVAETFAEAELALRSCLEGQVFGAAGDTVVLEERMCGEEASLFVISDGERWLCLPPAQDHKRLLDGDRGPNTGGMGAYAPAPVCDASVLAQVEAEVVGPTLAGLRAEGRTFVGALFVGLMIDRGRARVIEYNCRFGDPEIQPVLFGLQAPIVPHLHAAARGELEARGVLPGAPAATVVIAAGGYPGQVASGAAIRGLAAVAALPDLKVFHAGTRRGASSDDDEGWVTAGGRVLGVCARGSDLRAAIARAYEGCARIEVVGGQHRRDIGGRALA